MRIQGSHLVSAMYKYGIKDEDLALKTGFSLKEIKSLMKEEYSIVTNQDAWRLAKTIGCHIEDILDMTSSHSEREILKGCISLMQELMDEFSVYLREMDLVNEDTPKDELFSITIPYTEIVRRLFLRGTTHSGGTSCAMKLSELGVKKWGEKFAYDNKEEIE